MLQENCYVVSDETKEAVVIDCGAWFKEERQAIVDYIDGNGLKPCHLLCTHGHFDHCSGNDTIYNHYGLKPEAAKDDQWLMEGMVEQTEKIVGVRLNMDVPPVGRYLMPNDEVTFGSHTLKVLATPGHTPGSVMFYCEAEHVVFSGDTLFKMSVGRTDFERGSYTAMVDSLQTIAKLPADTTVLSGHGAQTTIGDELMFNPFLNL